MDESIFYPELNIVQIATKYPDENRINCRLMEIGNDDQNNIYRILIQFDFCDLPQDIVIINARLKMYTTTVVKEKSLKVIPYLIISEWSIDTVSWNNQPIYNENVFGQSRDMKTCGYYSYDITQIIQNLYKKREKNVGFILKSDQENEVNYAYILTCLQGGYKPVVEICYKLKCICEMKSVGFMEKMENLEVDAEEYFTDIQDTSLYKMLTYFIKNLGSGPIQVQLQISPDGITFIDQNESIIVDSNELKALVPYIYAKYIRLKIKTMDRNEKIQANIWYQSQQY
ncbi:DUF6385 domain-containing protein [Inediibacterium massiliense]|uniref:DUF6385 domain-containing protein n=1 Tax=Inediibacterium massiliense TaxID=1658111 RepID=UPI0006B63554|nr:DUF6385 domain-containing protein [Inediibacterium massiliense]